MRSLDNMHCMNIIMYVHNKLQSVYIYEIICITLIKITWDMQLIDNRVSLHVW